MKLLKNTLVIIIIFVVSANLLLEQALVCAIAAEPSSKNNFSQSAEDLFNNVKDYSDKSISDLKENAKEVAGAAKEKTNEAASKASELSEKAKETAKEKGAEAVEKTKETASKAKETATEAGKKAADYASEKAAKASERVKEVTNSFKKRSKELFESFDKEEFKRGYETAANLLSTTASTAAVLLKDQNYINSISQEILSTREAIYQEAIKEGPIASKAGYIAEHWHAGSFNASAKAANKADYASALGSNKPASVDVELVNANGDITNYSLKYYKDGASSASAQAKNFMQEYMKRVDKCKKQGIEPPTQEEFLNEYAASNDMSSMYDSVYKGQKRLIPYGQEQEAAEALKQKIAKEAAKNRDASSGLVAGYEDTLSDLTATVKNADGSVSSVPLTKEDADKIVELCRSDPDAFKPEDFGLSTAQLVPMSHIANMALQGGAQAAIINVALVVGPELYQIIKQLVETGDLDEKALKESGINALTEGSKGFLEGAASTAIIECCKVEKFGAAFTDVNPSVVGALTVVTVDAAVYAYQLNKGQISPTEYGDILAEEIFVSAVSLGSGALVQALLPMIPGAYFAGSIAGSMLASAGYSIGKDVVLAVVDSGSLDMVMPVTLDDKSLSKKDFLTLNLTKVLEPFKELKVKKNQDFNITILNIRADALKAG